LRVIKNSWAAAKIILSAATPIQKLIDYGSATHNFINNQAVLILKNDKYPDASALMKKNIEHINSGTVWADKGWKCFAHYYNPHCEEGLKPWPSALYEAQNYFSLAIEFLKNKKYKKSFFFLGAAAHLVQDLCVPHHSRCIAFNGHQRFEKWARKSFNNFIVNRGGLYQFKDISEIIRYNARTSYEYYDCVSVYDTQRYSEAASVLLTQAQKSTAGLFYLYMLSH
jgi:phospholipase C